MAKYYSFACAFAVVIGPAVALAEMPGVGQQSTAHSPVGGPKALNATSMLRHRQSVRIVCLGDSVTGVFYHTGGLRAYSDMLEIALRESHPDACVEVINAGINGNTTSDALARLESDVLKHDPALVTVMFGLNDMTRVSLGQYRNNLDQIVARCRSIGAEVLLVTPNNVISTPTRPSKKLEEYCNVIREVGRDSNVQVVDVNQGMEAIKAQNNEKWRELMSDELHPNLAGHKFIAEQLAEVIGGSKISLAEAGLPVRSIYNELSKRRPNSRKIVLAMSPIAECMGPILSKTMPDAHFDVISWPINGTELSEIAREAQTRVRSKSPDLVVLAIPRGDKAAPVESFIRDYIRIMNWSLSFAKRDWDVLVVHPQVFDPEHADIGRDDLIRRLVKAQDLPLIDRVDANGNDTPCEIIDTWFASQRQ